MGPADEAQIAKLLPVWEHLSDSEREGLIANTVSMHFDKGAHIHSGGADCIGVLLIASGSLRAYMLSDNGREVTLFHMAAGESCVLSASCILELITFDIYVDAEKPCEVYVISPSFYKALLDSNPYVEGFSYKQTAERFSEVMWVMQQVLFMSFDRRLAIYLLDERARANSDTLALTHERIAKDMGSAREVVTRMLGYFAEEGMVELTRGGVTLLDKPRLRELTQ